MVMTIYSHMMGGKSQTKPVQKESTELINRRKLTQSNSLISYGSFPDQLNLAPRSFFFFPINNLYYFRPTFSQMTINEDDYGYEFLGLIVIFINNYLFFILSIFIIDDFFTSINLSINSKLSTPSNDLNFQKNKYFFIFNN